MPDDIHKATPWEVLHKTKNTKGERLGALLEVS